MICPGMFRISNWMPGLLVLAVGWLAPGPSFGQEPLPRFRRRAVETRFAPRVVVQGSEFLGTFEPTPFVYVRGNGPSAGGGYSPFQVYGDQTMVMYGPTSVFRSTTAPVTTYVRGYDGELQPVSGISFSTPNLPGLSPVVYPTRSSGSYYAPRGMGEAVIRPRDSINWIDHN